MTAYDRAQSTPRWEEYSDTHRTDWENKYGGGRKWQEHEPAYRYGWESAQTRGDREWADAETDLERGWPEYRNKHRGHDMGDHDTVGGKTEHAWENFKDTVREGWDRARLEWNKRT
jgi:hypothetical protein